MELTRSTIKVFYETAYYDISKSTQEEIDENYMNVVYLLSDWAVLMHVARRGFKKHLDVLVHHESQFVRHEVAKHGYKEHIDILKKNGWLGISKIKHK